MAYAAGARRRKSWPRCRSKTVSSDRSSRTCCSRRSSSKRRRDCARRDGHPSRTGAASRRRPRPPASARRKRPACCARGYRRGARGVARRRIITIERQSNNNRNVPLHRVARHWRSGRSGITLLRLCATRGGRERLVRKLIFFVVMAAVTLSSSDWVGPAARADEAPAARHKRVRQACTGPRCGPYAPCGARCRILPRRVRLPSPLWRLRPLRGRRILGCLYLQRLGSVPLAFFAAWAGQPSELLALVPTAPAGPQAAAARRCSDNKIRQIVPAREPGCAQRLGHYPWRILPGLDQKPNLNAPYSLPNVR